MINRDDASILGAEFGVNFETMTGYGDAPMLDVEFAPVENPGDTPMTEAVLEVKRDAQSEQIFAITGIRPDYRRPIPPSELQEMVVGVKSSDPTAAEKLIAAKLPYVYRHIQRSDEVVSRGDLTMGDVLDMACLAIIDAGVRVGAVSPNLSNRISGESARKLDKLITSSKFSKDFSVDVTGEEDELSEIATGRSSRSEVEDAVVLHDIPSRLLEDLSWRQRYVLERRFGLGDVPDMYLEEIGVELGVTRERVRQIELQALRGIRLVHGKRNPHRHGVVPEEFYDTWMPER